MHEYKNGFLPVVFNGYWPTNREIMDLANNDRELRGDYDLHISFCRLTSSSKTPYFSLPRIWNNFNEPQITIICDRSKFKLTLKRHLISELNDNPICGRLFCHSCSNV